MEESELTKLFLRSENQKMNLTLDRMKLTFKEMGSPCKDIPAIQVVGTNGKGSISSFLKSGLNAGGINSGVTTSPHLISWCERIYANKGLISLEEFKEKIEKLKPLIKKHCLTPFEIVIAIAFDYFSTANVEVLILEVGMGGRFDATSAHSFRPIIAMASIGLDHCEHLGKTLKEVAEEKAATITPKSIVISSRQDPSVAAVIEKATINQQATLHWVRPLSENWSLGIPGLIQRQNAAVAKKALEALTNFGVDITEKQIQEGFAKAKLLGRLQKVFWKGMPLYLDGAHNPHAAKQLSLERDNLANENKATSWIIGIQSHKDGPNILRSLLRPLDTAWIVPIPGHKSWKTSSLIDSCPKYESQINEAKSVEHVLKKLSFSNRWNNNPIIICGSLYLIADLLACREIILDLNKP